VAANGAECAQIFRIAQEAIGNALRHASPRAIDVTLASDDQALCLIVEDDGRGFVRTNGETGGYGLRIMEHRAKLIGASLSIISSQGDGTKVICRLKKHAQTAP
jgi:signal transduction histidine kinase